MTPASSKTSAATSALGSATAPDTYEPCGDMHPMPDYENVLTD
jgi:hypothetical protein